MCSPPDIIELKLSSTPESMVDSQGHAPKLEGYIVLTGPVSMYLFHLEYYPDVVHFERHAIFRPVLLKLLVQPEIGGGGGV